MPSAQDRSGPDLPPPLQGAARAEAAAVRTALGLPERVQRTLAGAPISVDGQTLAAETQLMLRLNRVARKPVIESLPIPAGRRALDALSSTLAGRQPVGAVRDLEVAGRPARLYTPQAGPGRAPAGGLPLLVFFHGGGYFQGSLDSHDGPCRLLTRRARTAVLAVDYRLAPEHAFPAAHDDAVAAYRWALDHADELGVDPQRIGVGGDSAGGTLSAWVALHAAREGWPVKVQLLVYPATEVAERDTVSAGLFREGFFLSGAYMDLATASYTPDPSVRTDERVSPLRATVPDGLAPALVYTAGFDPLRDEGEAYARKLADAGVPIEFERFPDLIHSFFNVVGVGRRNRAAVERIADRLRVALHG